MSGVMRTKDKKIPPQRFTCVKKAVAFLHSIYDSRRSRNVE
jgi:hypothetical protein